MTFDANYCRFFAHNQCPNIEYYCQNINKRFKKKILKAIGIKSYDAPLMT